MSKFKIEIKWGILFTLMMLAWMVLEKLAGLHNEHNTCLVRKLLIPDSSIV